jgi:hypothetical protein
VRRKKSNHPFLNKNVWVVTGTTLKTKSKDTILFLIIKGIKRKNPALLQGLSTPLL